MRRRMKQLELFPAPKRAAKRAKQGGPEGLEARKTRGKSLPPASVSTQKPKRSRAARVTPSDVFDDAPLTT